MKFNSISRRNHWVSSMWILMEPINCWLYVLYSKHT